MKKLNNMVFKPIVFILVFVLLFNLLGLTMVSYAKDKVDNTQITLSDKDLIIQPGFDYTGIKKEKPNTGVKFTDEQMKKAKIIFKVMKEKNGFSELEASAFVGNLFQESAFQNEVVNSIGAIGMVQWLNDRRTKLEQFAKSKGKDAKDLEVQVEFIGVELKDPYFEQRYGSRKKNAKTLADFVALDMIWYETPGVGEANFSNRLGAAMYAYKEIAGKDLSNVDIGSSKEGSKGESGSSSSGGEGYTGNLEFNPFIKGKPVQNTTGIDKKDSQVGSNESYMVMSALGGIITFIMMCILILSAIYVIIMAIIVLGIALDTPFVTENKILRKIAGAEFIDNLRGEGVKGCLKEIGIKFLVPMLLLTFCVTSTTDVIQSGMMGKALEVIDILF